MNRKIQVVTEQPNPDKYLTVTEVRGMLLISQTRVSQLVHSETLKAVRYGPRIYVTRASVLRRLSRADDTAGF